MAQDGFTSQSTDALVFTNEQAAKNLAKRSDVRVLLIEDSAADAKLIQEFLKGGLLYQFHLTHVERLQEALQRVQTTSYGVILLDLTLPDSTGLRSLEQLLTVVPNTPVLVLTNTDNPELAIEAVRQGAQDYLIKRQMNADSLVRSLRYSIERKQQEEALREANEALEIRVRSRTRELEQANQQLREEVVRRQAVQERLFLAKRAGKIGIFEWDIRTDQMTWSDELETLYGASKADFDGHCDSWLNLLCQESKKRVTEEIWRSVTLGRGLDTEFKIEHPNGSRWIVVKSDLFNGEDGKPARMLGIHMDITDKKQLEAQFLQAQRLESLGALASGIAHDLNNILTPILGAAHLLPMLAPDMDEKALKMVDTLNCSAQRGTKLVRQIVSFARNSSSFRQVLSVDELLDEIERIIAQTLPCAIDIQRQVSPNLWLVNGDDTQLHQVFMNLCVNARDAMPEGGELRLTAENLLVDQAYQQMHPNLSSGPYVVVTVSDTGIGMEVHTLERIFDPFFTTKSSGHGTGLGLAAVLGIVKSHGGVVDAQSTVGIGSEFKVYLPATSESADKTAAPPEKLRGQEELILVVDDEPEICKVLQASLENYGYRVLTAEDGIGAIALLAEHRSELNCILIDLMMPGMDGRKAIPLLRRLNSDIPIVAMTGSVSQVSPSDLKQLSLQNQLVKPFTTHDLLMLLKSLFQAS